MGACLSILELVLGPPLSSSPDQPGSGAAPTSTTGSSGAAAGGDSTSPIYPHLPSGAEKQSVRNVYDGDTLTLNDNERRVRFLGVDTPELKEHQPFAQEAKDYTKSKCPNHSDVYLVVENKDHYGRELAWVYVEQQQQGGYLCVNEGLIHQGFAHAYVPDKDSKPANWNKLLALQASARQSKRGLWKSFVDSETVYATTNGSAYHKRSCTHLSNSHNLTELKISEATDRGLHPCRTCMG